MHEAATSRPIGAGGDREQRVEGHLRMTEKRRLAMAAAAIKPKMMTLRRVLVFCALPPERVSRGWAVIVATGGEERQWP